MKVGLVLQARTGSKRLPHKVIRNIVGISMLERILSRLERIDEEWQIIVATTRLSSDDIVEDIGRSRGHEVFRGSEDDVLKRYYRCARDYNLDHIFRLTGDNPYVDIDHLPVLYRLHTSGCFDYTESITSMPVGVGSEIFTHEALCRCNRYAVNADQREHANEYILQNKESFNIGSLKSRLGGVYSGLSLTVDNVNEFDLAVKIQEYYNKEFVSTLEALEFARLHQQGSW